jgi:hypothetical protein
MRFLLNTEFGFPERFNATPWGVEVIIQLACGPARRMGLRNPDGTRLEVSNANQDAFRCEITRGDGELLAAIPPHIVPSDPDSSDFIHAAEGFVTRCIQFCRDNISLIVEVLTAPNQ